MKKIKKKKATINVTVRNQMWPLKAGKKLIWHKTVSEWDQFIELDS